MTMTNNPTIDGVSRKALEQALLAMKRIYQAGYDRILEAGGQCDTPEYMMAGDPTARELRALLDAPAVERQELVQMASMPVERCYDVRAKMIIAFNEAKKAGGDLDDALEAAYQSALRFSPAPQDFADQQSTIARLEARIAELESGRGEPVAFIQIPKNVEKYGHADQADRLCFGKPGQFFVDGKSPMFDFIPLYIAPPAPVAVVQFANELIDGAFEGGNFDGGDIQDIGVKHGLLSIETRDEPCGEFCACKEYGFPAECYRKTACLDATAALNGPDK